MYYQLRAPYKSGLVNIIAEVLQLLPLVLLPSRHNIRVNEHLTEVMNVYLVRIIPVDGRESISATSASHDKIQLLQKLRNFVLQVLRIVEREMKLAKNCFEVH